MIRQFAAVAIYIAIYFPGRLIGKAFGIDPDLAEALLMIAIVTPAVLAQCVVLWWERRP